MIKIMTKEMLSVEQALELNKKDLVDYYKNHVNPALAKMLALLNFDKQYVKAAGCKVWDSEGVEYLDFLGGYGALNLGHNPPAVLEAIRKVETLPNLLQASMGTMLSVAAYNLSLLSPGDLSHSFFCNSGAEAVEAALKLARIASGKEKIIYCQDSFHGKTLGALSVTGREKYQLPFKPLIPGFEKVPFADLASLEFKFKSQDVAAFILEPIQGEGGIIIPPKGYLKKVRELCTKYNVYLILDEIQTGFARTGALFACQLEDVVPDIMCLAKSLGGGVVPIGAYICKKEIWKKAYDSMDKALLHTSTFGGNTLAATAAIATMTELVNLNLSQEAQEKGDYLLSELKKMATKYELIKEVRGQGLLIGIEFKQKEAGFFNKISKGMLNKLAHEYTGSLIAGILHQEYQIITAYTLNNPNVIRLEPPLIVSYEEIDQLIEALDAIFNQYKSLLDIAKGEAKKRISSIFK